METITSHAEYNIDLHTDTGISHLLQVAHTRAAETQRSLVTPEHQKTDLEETIQYYGELADVYTQKMTSGRLTPEDGRLLLDKVRICKQFYIEMLRNGCYNQQPEYAYGMLPHIQEVQVDATPDNSIEIEGHTFTVLYPRISDEYYSYHCKDAPVPMPEYTGGGLIVPKDIEYAHKQWLLEFAGINNHHLLYKLLSGCNRSSYFPFLSVVVLPSEFEWGGELSGSQNAPWVDDQGPTLILTTNGINRLINTTDHMHVHEGIHRIGSIKNPSIAAEIETYPNVKEFLAILSEFASYYTDQQPAHSLLYGENGYTRNAKSLHTSGMLNTYTTTTQVSDFITADKGGKILDLLDKDLAFNESIYRQRFHAALVLFGVLAGTEELRYGRAVWDQENRAILEKQDPIGLERLLYEGLNECNRFYTRSRELQDTDLEARKAKISCDISAGIERIYSLGTDADINHILYSLIYKNSDRGEEDLLNAFNDLYHEYGALCFVQLLSTAESSSADFISYFSPKIIELALEQYRTLQSRVEGEV